jgi:hypothetical protein
MNEIARVNTLLPLNYSQPLEARMRRVLASLHDPTVQMVDQITALITPITITITTATEIITITRKLKYRQLLSSVLRWGLWPSFVLSFSSFSVERTRVVKEGWDYGNGSAIIGPPWTIALIVAKPHSATPILVNTCTRTTSSQGPMYPPIHGRVLPFRTMETTP